jgi:hypothetical protein
MYIHVDYEETPVFEIEVRYSDFDYDYIDALSVTYEVLA